MIPLLDTAIGFAAIMLMLSLLVKTLTSLVKNYVDYYSTHLRAEVDQLLQGTLGSGIEAVSARHPWLKGVNWKGLGESFLTVDKMALLIRQLDPAWTDAGDLATRLDLHVANLKYGFEQRMKNLALAAGLALCLLANVNALTIWKTLYTDEQVRTTFATEYAQKAMDLAGQMEGTEGATSGGEQPEKPNAGPGAIKTQGEGVPGGASQSGARAVVPHTPAAKPAGDPQSGAKPVDEEQLKERAQALRGSIDDFLADVNFGVGRIWREANASPQGLGVGDALYELLGSLLTGILISIGAPYWHDLLRALSSFRTRAKPPAVEG
jgi:hypothetical protein